MRLTVLLISSSLAMACGGSGSSGAGNGDAPTTDETVPEEIGNSFSVSGENLSMVINGERLETYIDSTTPIMGQPLPWVANAPTIRKFFIAIESTHPDSGRCGDNTQTAHVCGLGVSYFDGSNYYDGFGLSGIPATNLPNSAMEFEGIYMVIDAREYSGQRLIVEGISITADFAANTISGYTPAPVSDFLDVTMTGSISGSTIDLNIDGPLGIYDATGGFYGTDAEELAAGFAEDGVVGLVYGIAN